VTTTVSVHAHCGNDEEVEVIVYPHGESEADYDELHTLQDGEHVDVSAYDDRVVQVREKKKQ